MRIQQIQLRQFRNHDQRVLEFAAHKNLILGKNGAGKTNILEAVHFLSHGKSQRTSQDRELVQWDKPFATLRLEACSETTQTVLEAQLVYTTQGTLRTGFKLDGNPVKARSQIVGKIPTVTFFVSDLLMLRGSPEDRRQALDRSLVQYDPLHYTRLQAYQRVKLQKAQLLKHGLPDENLLDTLNDQLAETGAAVMTHRMQYLLRLETIAALRYLELSQNNETLSLAYRQSFSGVLREAIDQAKSEEIRRGQVLIGPHRDDIAFYLDHRDAALYASQGQQRSIVLAFKLAEMSHLQQKLGDSPVLLLDDVMAELDLVRQHALVSHLNPDMQVILTTTSLSPETEWFLQSDAQARVFHMSADQVPA